MISRLYSYSIKQEKNPYYFENVNVKKLKELKEVLNHLRQVYCFLISVNKLRNGFTSERLKNLTGFNSSREGLVPDYDEVLQKFEKVIDWKKLGQGKDSDQVPEPSAGVYPAYDEAKETIFKVEKLLEEQLEHWKSLFNDQNIEFVHKKYVFCIMLYCIEV